MTGQQLEMLPPTEGLSPKPDHCIHGDQVVRPECDGCELARLRTETRLLPLLREGLRLYLRRDVEAWQKAQPRAGEVAVIVAPDRQHLSCLPGALFFFTRRLKNFPQ